MSDAIKLRVTRGSNAKITNKDFPKEDGRIYFATDTGNIYLGGPNGKLFSMGGSGSGGAGAAIYYAETPATLVPDDDDMYLVFKSVMENSADSPVPGDIILNITDGTFFRVITVVEDGYQCERLAVSGNGNGPGGVTGATLTIEQPSANVINGQDVQVWVTAKSLLEADEITPMDSKLVVTWRLTDMLSGVTYATGTADVLHNVRTAISIGGYLRASTRSECSMYVRGINSGQSTIKTFEITASEMKLTHTSTFSNTTTYSPGEINFTFNTVGNLEKIAVFTYDEGRDTQWVYEKKLSSSENTWDVSVRDINLTNHGYHTIKVELFQSINGERGLSVDPLEFEIAVIDPNRSEPVIWLGNYKKVYEAFDDIQIPFLVKDPQNNSSVMVTFKRGGKSIGTREIKTFSSFNIFEIVDASMDIVNYYSIECGEGELKVEREISFEIIAGSRTMEPVKGDQLVLNFNAKGRSNDDPLSRRLSWVNDKVIPSDKKGVQATFTNFNWTNNGWMMDNNRNSMLRISNGAKVEFDLGLTQFADTNANEQSHTFEFQFKVQNIQNYANLVKNTTRYKKDGDYYNAFINPEVNIWKHTNYDAFLHDYLTPDVYEALEFDFVQKDLNFDNIMCNYFRPTSNGAVGLCLGPQDAFFSNGSDTVNINYVEDDMINLSIVYEHLGAKQGLIYIYVNGVITGVSKSEKEAFGIDGPKLTFDSRYCDIDLYSMRIYKTALNVNDIVMNYAIDHKDVITYDQKNLAVSNQAIGEYQLSYEKMLEYNDAHPDDPLMPYIVFDTSKLSSSILPESKATTINVDCTFVNTVLDRAYAAGELEALAGPDGDGLFLAGASAEVKAAAVKNYYKHHCPSWTGSGVEMVVQGTSSEFYPRRNYKIKTKIEVGRDEKNEPIEKAQIYLNRGPFEEDYARYQQQALAGELVLGEEPSRQDFWYMDNYTNGTHKWTMKVDYMESSGSYNAGFASMIANAYSQHPLKKYVDAGIIDPYEKNKEGRYVDKDGNELSYTFERDDEGKIINAVFNTADSSKRVNLLHSPVTKSMRWQDYRTSLLGFPVMAFHKKSVDNSDVIFIGYYRMLLDKGSDEVLGFKPPKTVTNKLLGNKDVRKKAECWEFSTNARTYTSYKDPENRTELSFLPSQACVLDGTGLTDQRAPIMANHFEYRYNDNEDWLDDLYKLKQTLDDPEKKNAIETEFEIQLTEETGRQLLVDLHENWERACQWVWSTNQESVYSENIYTAVPVGKVKYEPGKFYVLNINEEDNTYSYDICEDAEWKEWADEAHTERMIYRDKVEEEIEDEETGEVSMFVSYPNAYAVPEDYVYKKFTFYKQDAASTISREESYSLVTDNEFDATITYYAATARDVSALCNLLVTKCGDAEFDSSKIYYTYDGSVKCPTDASFKDTTITLAVQKANVTAENYEPNKYYIPTTITYNGIPYQYDSKEYRGAKFFNDFSKHFDVEYMATYFVATEVFELYDSRGKNCMMASWGPLEAGGDYVWFPIFYDIDTQLGINNTGIPSFEFNVDATEAGNYSTSDSVLWNNFYKYFKNSYILQKYQHMKNKAYSGSWPILQNPPLQSVEHMEGWYSFDPKVNKMIACRGRRPLIATNLDAYWKYITITNSKGLATGITGYLNREGKYVQDTKSTYFYALQGDRSQSRQQFLTNRLEYIDSWLNQGNYARGGENCIRGRVSANNPTDTSDTWLESRDGYYNADGTKKYPFDAEYWLNLTPIRSSYVTLSDDSAAYPSKKYDGITPVKFNIDAIESGVRDSENYPEQLLYVYGMNQMADVGNMHNLYWREFYIDGDAAKLTKLNLGYDGKVPAKDKDGNPIYEEDGSPKYLTWFNKKLNVPGIPSKKPDENSTSKGMPLLKEVNLSNISIQAGSGQPTMNFTSCEKLENFRATGSTLTDISFADGVALNTLYLPASLTNLTLTEANLLTNLITEYHAPEVQDDGSLKAEPGLYIERLFEDGNCALSTINLHGGALGYHSHTLLRKFYDMISKKSGGGNITMTNVAWSPYVKVAEGEEYDANANYVIDNHHYGFTPYVHKDNDEFTVAVLSGLMYREVEDSENIINAVDDDTITMLLNMATESKYKSASSKDIPEITGLIYVNNTTEYDEARFIRDRLQAAYPQLTFFFKNPIKQAYSARFVVEDSETGAVELAKPLDGTASAVQKIAVDDPTKTFFNNPYGLYEAEKEHWDFHGWSTDGTIENVISNEDWDTLTLDPNTMTYTFYAVFTIHQYDIYFKDATNSNYNETIKITYGDRLNANVPMPVNENVTELYSRNGFRGWTMNVNNSKVYPKEAISLPIVDITKYIATDDYYFYAVYQEESVFDTVTDSKYFDFAPGGYSEQNVYGTTAYDKTGYTISCKPEYIGHLRGKITLPTVTPSGINGVEAGKPIIALQGFRAQPYITHVFFDNKNTNEIRAIYDNAFSINTEWINAESQLQYVDFAAMSSLRRIGNSAFAGAFNLTDFTLYEPLVEIGGNAFANAGRKEHQATLTIPATVQNILSYAFQYGCDFTDVYIGSATNATQLTQNAWYRDGEIIRNDEDKCPDVVHIFCKDIADKAKWDAWMNGEGTPLIRLGTYIGPDGSVLQGTYDITIVGG